MAGLRRHITYANVVATIALLLAVGTGGVYAAAKIGGSQIRKGAVRSKQIKNRNVKRQDIAGGAINSRKVSNQSLTGKDIKEQTLEIVPLAENAHTVNGVAARVVRFSLPDPGSSSAVSENGLSAGMTCAGGGAEIELSGSVPGDSGTVFDSESGTTQDFANGAPATVTTAGETAGFATLRRIDGTVVRLDFELRRLDGGFGGAGDCFLHGFLLGGA